jgi:L-amino acid N-acyltransferase YncA
MSIRLSVNKDIEQIREIYNDAVLNTTATFDVEPRTIEEQKIWYAQHKGKYPVIVYESDGIIAGWASLSRWSDRTAYSGTAEDSIYVRKDYRQRGIGRELLYDLIQRAVDLGLHTVIARISEGNKTSIKIHLELGFEIIGIMKDAGWKFGRYIDVTLMQKIL